MKPISQFLYKPINYKDKDLPRYNDITLVSIQENQEQKNIILTLTCNSLSNNKKYYIEKIWINTIDIISPSNLVKFNCTCKSFKYQYSTLLYFSNNLLGQPESTKRPKKQHRIFICKHLYGCLYFISSYKSISNLKKLI